MLLFYKSASSTCLCVDTSRKIRKQTSLKKFCWVIHILSDWSIARIFYFFMYWLNMSLQIHLLSRLMITLIARIFSFHLQTEYHSSDLVIIEKPWRILLRIIHTDCGELLAASVMLHLYVRDEFPLVCGFVFTWTAGISDSQMIWLQMMGKLSLR